MHEKEGGPLAKSAKMSFWQKPSERTMHDRSHTIRAREKFDSALTTTGG